MGELYIEIDKHTHRINCFKKREVWRKLAEVKTNLIAPLLTDSMFNPIDAESARRVHESSCKSALITQLNVVLIRNIIY